MSEEYDLRIEKLGPCKIPSPVHYSTRIGDSVANYTRDSQFVWHSAHVELSGKGERPSSPDGPQPYDHRAMLEEAGPRQNIYFSPSQVKAAIVTCGGLCPGLNDVIRALVRTLWYFYGVRRIEGIPYGYRGFLPEFKIQPVTLNPDVVDDIHKIGGTMLGSSRGCGYTEAIVDAMERMNINMLFTIGGDGTQRGTLAISREIRQRGLKISCVGIPKTIDNDIMFTEKTFGFDTAVSKAVEAVGAAHIEAKSAIDGIGLVKVMGRDSGFIAAHTTLSTSDVNFCLIPEIAFAMEGENGLLNSLKKRLDSRRHAVIIAAEGAGQHLMSSDSGGTDASGNQKYADIGLFLKEKINHYFTERKREVNLKYIDPGYIIRATPASPADSHYCARLAANAVHAAMSGRTACLISLWNNTLVHVPVEMATRGRRTVNSESALWRDVLESTRQPLWTSSSSTTKPL